MAHEKPKHETGVSKTEALAALEEISLQRAVVHFLENTPDVDAILKKDPLVVLRDLISQIPDSPAVISRDEARIFSENVVNRNGRHSALDYGKVSDLEAYLVAKVALHNPEAVQFQTYDIPAPMSFSVTEGVHCLRDGIRIKRFLEAIEISVRKLEKRRPSGVITVCDAGSGAIPIMGMYAALVSSRVHSICLEEHPYSAKLARSSVESLGLGDRVSVLEVDAISYEPSVPFDMLISETMDTGLLNEPLCDILEHLKRYSQSDAIVLPGDVEVYAATLLEEEYYAAGKFTHIDTYVSGLFNLPWVLVATYTPGSGVPEINGEFVVSEAGNHVVLVTGRVEFGVNSKPLEIYDSRITSPVPVLTSEASRPVTLNKKSGEKIRIRYRAGVSPVDIEID